MPSINGIAHIQVTVSDMERAVLFYEKLLHSLEMPWPHRPDGVLWRRRSSRERALR
jgi:hypothetical protein